MKKLIIATALILLTGTAFGQSVQKGNVIGLYSITVTLDPDVTLNQFLDYQINTGTPTFEKHFEGVKVFYLKGYRGEHENGYGLFVCVESIEVYDKYWDENGELTELGQSLLEKTKSVRDESDKLGKVAWEFTDWVVL